MRLGDILDPNFKQKSVMLISEESKLEIVTNPAYLPILESLRRGYKPIKEIEKDYVRFIESEARKRFKKDERAIKESVERRKRSDKSLYRYVRDLVKAGFVTLVGKRIDKPITEKLYARTAKLFLNGTYYERLICSSEAGIDSLSSLIGLVLGIPKPDSNAVKEFISQMERSYQETTDKLFKEIPEDYVEVVEELSLQEINAVLQAVSIVDLIANRDNYRRLLASLGERGVAGFV